MNYYSYSRRNSIFCGINRYDPFKASYSLAVILLLDLTCWIFGKIYNLRRDVVTASCG